MYKEKQTILRTLKQNSISIRHEEIQARANIAAPRGDTQSKNNLDKIRSSEAHAAMYRKIKAIRGKYHLGGFTSIKVPHCSMRYVPGGPLVCCIYTHRTFSALWSVSRNCFVMRPPRCASLTHNGIPFFVLLCKMTLIVSEPK